MSDSKSPSDESKPESIAELFDRGVLCHESNPSKAVTILQDVQQQVARLSLFSSNEELSDISTKSLPFLALEHYLALSFMSLPTGPQQMNERYSNLQRACDLWTAFFQRLDQLELIDKQERKQYNDLIEIQASVSSLEPGHVPSLPPTPNREAKIARFQEKQAALHEKQRLESLQQRRSRLGLAEHDELDGYDLDSLYRNIHLKNIDVCKAQALEEWTSVIRELPMILMMIRRQQSDPTYSSNNNTLDARQRPISNKPLQVTHITQDGTGQLQIRQEEIRSTVFQPHWNQPTMSLDELAEREVAAAMDRDARQEEASQANKLEARRYEFLKKDGLEDDHDLVDASAALDRKWDDWKDANPRGSGNKRGDVGDRNY